MTKKIKNHLKTNPSYLKWGVERLASKFGCSQRTMKNVLTDLTHFKQNYLESLRG